MTRKTASSIPDPLIVTPSPADTVEGAWFDDAAVDRVIKFFRQLKQVKGRQWRGVSLEPLEWQVEYVIKPVFGWKNPDGTRVVRTVWVEVPRKNGKSTISSGFGLYLLAADREWGGEVYSAAKDKLQARQVFDPAKQMALWSPSLRKRLTPLSDALVYRATGSVFRVLSSVAESKHGLNVSGAVIDEIHVHEKPDLIDTIETGTGSREQPLVIFITTADDGDEHSIYGRKRDYVEKLAKGILTDPTFYGVVFAADRKDNPFVEKTWKKANPGYGITVRKDYMKMQAERAKASPDELNKFLRLHLGIRTKSTYQWLSLQKWDAKECSTPIDESELEGKPCYLGLDLSGTTDLTSAVLVFPKTISSSHSEYTLLPYFWMPEENVDLRTETDQVPYDRWVEEGLIYATEGDVVDYAEVKKKILELRKRFKIQECGFDRWSAPQLAQELEAAGLRMVEVPQTFAGLSAPSKEFERLIRQKRLHHGGHEVLRWNADCVEVKQDDSDNIKPVKPQRLKSKKRIDGIVAAIMGLERALRRPTPKKSIAVVLGASGE